MSSFIKQTGMLVARQRVIQRLTAHLASRTMSTLPNYKYETLAVSSPKPFVYQVELNRPKKLNAMNKVFWREIAECFKQISSDQDCRAVVLSGSGRVFTAGLDLLDAGDILTGVADTDVGRKATIIKDIIERYQASFTNIEKCWKPTIAAVHNACIGGGIDMITACDIRYCTQDAFFQIKEIDIGITADVGTLQRLPKVVGNQSLVRELALTGRKMFSDEAKEFGLVSRVLPDKEQLVAAAIDTASQIAEKSPVAIQGTKATLLYSRDHSVDESLHYVAIWNQGMLQSEDVVKAVMAGMQKIKPEFAKL